jgi:hypothetical protein
MGQRRFRLLQNCADPWFVSTKSIFSSEFKLCSIRSSQFRISIIELMDIDFESASRQTATLVDSNQSSELRIRRVNLESERLSREMLRALGKTLGFKKGAIVVDACISDIYEIMTEKQSLSYGDAYIELLHEWIGSLVVAKEVSCSSLPMALLDCRFGSHVSVSLLLRS